MKESDSNDEQNKQVENDLLINLKNDENENAPLISDEDKTEKENLIKILNNISKNLSENKSKTIDKVYENYFNNKNVKKRKIRKSTNKCLVYFMFYIISPIFVIINLIGIFEVVSIMKALFYVLKYVLIIYFELILKMKPKIDYKKYNFYEVFFNSYFEKQVDFKLMMATDFLGCILLKSLGFRISSFIFLILNGIGIALLITFDFKDYSEKEGIFPFLHIFYLLLCYLIIFIATGASALMSQTILIDSFYLLKDYLTERHYNINIDENENEKDKKFEIREMDKIDNNSIHKDDNIKDFMLIEEVKNNNNEKNSNFFKDLLRNNKNNRFDYFFIICLTTILGFFGKFSLNLWISNKKLIYDKEQYKELNITSNINSDMEIIDTLNIGSNITEKIKENINNHDKYLFLFIILIYISTIIISLIIYSIFICIFSKNKKEKDKKKENQFSYCQLFGFTIYTQNIFNDKIIPKCECIQLLCKSYKNCCDKNFCEKPEKYKDIKRELHCCFCCCEYNNVNYELNNTFFCYCYKGKRKQKWFNNYIGSETQKILVNKLLNYFLFQLTIIYYEYIFNQNIDKENDNINKYQESLEFLIIFISTFIAFYFITISYGRLLSIKETDSNNSDKSDNKQKVSKFSYEIIRGISGITYINSLYCFILYLYYYYKDRNIFQTNKYIYPPLLLNKFYYFLLTYYSISYSEKQKGSDLLSSSTLISIYLLIWNFFYDCLVDYINYKVLYFIQFISSGFLSLMFVLLIFCLMLSSCLSDGCCFCCIWYICFGWTLLFCLYDENSHDCWGFYIDDKYFKCKCFCLDCHCCEKCDFDDDKDSEDEVKDGEEINKKIDDDSFRISEEINEENGNLKDNIIINKND